MNRVDDSRDRRIAVWRVDGGMSSEAAIGTDFTPLRLELFAVYQILTCMSTMVVRDFYLSWSSLWKRRPSKNGRRA
jgi:hypothetical protein